MGLKAFGRWLLLKFLRLVDHPHSVALGFSFGVLISFTPWVGLHLALAWGLCWLFGGGYLAAWLGTWMGNPWTFPFMWWGSLHLGRMLMHVSVDNHENVMAGMTLTRLFYDFDKIFYDVLLPMTVGGLILGAVAALLSYWPVRMAMARYQKNKKRRLLARKLERQMKEKD